MTPFRSLLTMASLRRVDDGGQPLIHQLRLLALDQICRLPSQHVQETKVTFRWLVWLRQCVEIMPSRRPVRETSGVDCMARMPALR